MYTVAKLFNKHPNRPKVTQSLKHVCPTTYVPLVHVHVHVYVYMLYMAILHKSSPCLYIHVGKHKMFLFTCDFLKWSTYMPSTCTPTIDIELMHTHIHVHTQAQNLVLVSELSGTCAMEPTYMYIHVHVALYIRIVGMEQLVYSTVCEKYTQFRL